jgi:Protein of unknown function (DUF3102)
MSGNLSPVLDGLAERINALHDASLSAMRQSFEHAAEAGRLLIEAKAMVGHGEWAGWLAANTQISERTARRWMRFAKHGREVAEKTATVADLAYADMDAALCLRDKLVQGARDSFATTVDHQVKIDESERLEARYREHASRRDAWLARHPSESECTSEALEEALALIIELCCLEEEWFSSAPPVFTSTYSTEYVQGCELVAQSVDQRSLIIEMLKTKTTPHLTPDQVEQTASGLRRAAVRFILRGGR